MKSSALALLLLLASCILGASACDDEVAPPSVAVDGCHTDLDCKGDRVCDPDTLLCVEPATAGNNGNNGNNGAEDVGVNNGGPDADDNNGASNNGPEDTGTDADTPDADAKADAPPDGSTEDVLLPDGERNACGGRVRLSYLGAFVEPGAACGACTDGLVICTGANTIACANATAANACGGCGPIQARPGTPCGVCGTYTCDGGDVVCVDDGRNDCGGCEPLDDAPGWLCDDGHGIGVWACRSTNTLACIRGGQNLCGGDPNVRLAALPGMPCGECNRGEVRCDGVDAIQCRSAERGVNACGGCAPLDGVPGQRCGGCGLGVWTCDPNDPDRVTCEGDARNACGGCAPLERGVGEGCGEGLVYHCDGQNRLVCGSDALNACGGPTVLSDAPNTVCGACGDGVNVCATPGVIVCVDDAPENACGGCGLLPGQPGEPCGTDHSWHCEDRHMRCRPNDEPDASLPGEACVHDAFCAGRLCLRLGPDTDERVCSSHCSSDAECDPLACSDIPATLPSTLSFCLATDLCTDPDNDGFGIGPRCTDIDCDEADASVNAGAAELCADGADNDDDGLVDCADPDCATAARCGEVCDNGVDDNRDGAVDCDDPRCFAQPACLRYTLEVVSGAAQQGLASWFLPDPIIVRVIPSSPDFPIQGPRVTFRPDAGVLTSPTETFADSDGLAVATVFTGRVEPGTYGVQVDVERGASLRVEFTVTAPMPGTITPVLNAAHAAGAVSGIPGPALDAVEVDIADVAAGADGTIYYTTSYSNAVRQITPDGRVETLAGDGQADLTNGPGAGARFNLPSALALDEANARLLVADYTNHVIRAIDLASPEHFVTTWAGGGPGLPNQGDDNHRTQATFAGPNGLAIGPGGHVFVLDGRLRRIDAATGIITSPPNANAWLPAPGCFALCPIEADADGLFVPSSRAFGGLDYLLFPADADDAVDRVPVSGLLGGDPYGAAVQTHTLGAVPSIALDAAGNLYASVPSHDGFAAPGIARLTRDTARIDRVLQRNDLPPGAWGDFGSASEAQVSVPRGLAVTPAGQLLIADAGTASIRAIWLDDLPAHTASVTILGTPPAQQTILTPTQLRAAVTLDGQPLTEHPMELVGSDGEQADVVLTSLQGEVSTIVFPSARPGPAALTVQFVPLKRHLDLGPRLSATFAFEAVAPPAGTILPLVNRLREGGVPRVPGPGPAVNEVAFSTLAALEDGTLFYGVNSGHSGVVRRVTPDGHVLPFFLGGELPLLAEVPVSQAHLGVPVWLAADEAAGLLTMTDNYHHIFSMALPTEADPDPIVHLIGGTGVFPLTDPVAEGATLDLIDLSGGGRVTVEPGPNGVLAITHGPWGLLATPDANGDLRVSIVLRPGDLVDGGYTLDLDRSAILPRPDGGAWVVASINGAHGLFDRAPNGALSYVGGFPTAQSSTDDGTPIADYGLPRIFGARLRGDTLVLLSWSSVLAIDTATPGLPTRRIAGDNGANGAGGDYGPAADAVLYYPTDLALDGRGNLYIAEGNVLHMVWR